MVEYSNDNVVWQSQIAGTNTNFILSGLNHSSTYYLRVYSLCSSTDTSFSVNTIFNTECSNINQFPWIESFEGITSNNQLPNCWTATNISDKTYTYTSNQSSYNRIARTGTKFATFKYSSNDNFTTPTFDLNAGTNYSFTFWYITDGSDGWQNLQVRAIDLSDTTNNVVIGTPVVNAVNENYEIYLSNFTPTTTGAYKFRIECQATSSPWYLSFDDVKLDEANCLFPENVQLSNVTPTTVDMTWDAGVNTAWIVDYKISTDTVWTSDIAYTNQYTFTQLNPITAYDFRVASLCTNDTSLYINLSQTTPCSYISTLPWNDSFDTYGTGSSIYPQCWSRLYNATSANPYISSTNFSAPGSMYFTAASGKYSIAATPGFDPSIPINTLSAMFRLRTSNATSKLTVGVMSNPNDTLTFDSITTLIPTATSTWQEFEVDFANYTGTGNYIAFKTQYNTASNTCYIDDLSVYSTPSCARPIAISASSLTNSIDVTITPADPSDTEWKVYFRDVNTTDWDSITAVTAVVTIPNLLTQTEYEIYAKTVCSDGSNSNATNSIIIPTQQIPEQIPYTCDFETPGNNGWLLKNGTCTNKWMIGTPTSGTSNALFVSNNNADATYTLNTFSVVVAEKLFEFNTLDSIQLTFDLTIGGESSFDYLKVFLVDKDTVFNPSTAATYFAVNSYAQGVIMQNATNNYINLLTGTQTLSTTFASPGVGEQMKLIFVWKNDGSSGNANSSIIDNVSLISNNPCIAPTNLSVTSVTNTSANVTWTPDGTETQWQVRLGQTETPIDVTTTSHTLTGLTESTNYTVYVRANCGGTYSNWVSLDFTTLSGPYSPEVTTLLAESISFTSVTLNGSYLLGSDTITSIGFEYRPVGTTTWTSETVGNIVTPFLKAITGLTSNTQYEFKAFVTSTTFNTTYGDIVTFTTLPIVSPTVTTLMPNPISYTTATFLGTITQGSEEINARGFEYKLQSQTWQDGTPISATGTDNISASVTSLQQGTTYEVRAYARTASTTTYGTTITFSTLTQGVTPPTVNTLVADQIGDRSAILLGTVVVGNEAITDQGFEWKVASASTWTPVTVVPVNDTLNYQLTGIEPTTNYEFKAYATTATTTTYGTTQTFMTLGINEIDGSLITVMMYPNPTSEETKLVVTGLQGDVKIIVSDVQGRIINTINSRANNNKVEVTLNVSDMAKGVYYVRLQNEQVSRTQKLIVK